ncbi:methylamine utilization protein [Rheinheimera sp. UJ51]|uniref:methylamine utilization protein n=1 Tax=Rheinheimera sp. UJ51 TaxID=2892446 RepID=UPI001E390444|nr:methylamine utilization protein [Rheinheimera sp. UJ51]MCC5451859.1 methylamine utilization protein [Rheinheimera sp. UJ51]
MNPKRRLYLVTAFILLQSALVQAASLNVSVKDAQGRVVNDAVVFLESTAAAALVKAGPLAQIKQRDKVFTPELTVITKGTAVSFPNEDTVRHHVYSFSPVKQFEIKLYVGTPAEPVVFEQSGVAVLGCNIHDHMIAWIVALDTPYYAITDENGRATLKDVPTAEYQLRIWHKDLIDETHIVKLPLTLTENMAEQQITLMQLAPMF